MILQKKKWKNETKLIIPIEKISNHQTLNTFLNLQKIEHHHSHLWVPSSDNILTVGYPETSYFLLKSLFSSQSIFTKRTVLPLNF